MIWRFFVRAIVLTGCAVGLLVLLMPSVAVAQETGGMPLYVVEAYVNGKVKPLKVWNDELNEAGIAFVMDDAMETRLRNAGAGDEWIAVLRKSRYNPPIAASPSPASQSTRRTPVDLVAPTLTKAQLHPIYFGNEARITPYVSVLNLTETGGSVEGHVIDTWRGRIRLDSRPLARSALAYGMVIDYRSVGLDIEASFQKDLLMLNLGAKYSPFLPIGTSGVRVIAGVKPFLGITRQTLATLATNGPNGEREVVDILNNVVGGDVSAGLAYHWRPGAWVFAEMNYRSVRTLARELRTPDEKFTEGIPWSNWKAQGWFLRFGVGF